MNKFFIKKDDPRLPDSYGIELTYVNGKSETFDTANHFIDQKFNVLNIWTFNDEAMFFPLSNIQSVKFDKNWTKVVEVREEMERNKKNAAQS